jgi:hypothetical protein
MFSKKERLPTKCSSIFVDIAPYQVLQVVVAVVLIAIKRKTECRFSYHRNAVILHSTKKIIQPKVLIFRKSITAQ